MNETTAQPSEALTTRQQLAIAEFLGSPSIEEACRRTKVARGTMYKWLADPTFQAELKRQRETLVEQAFNLLKAGMNRAVEKLLGLLEVESQLGIQLRAAQTLLDQGIKVVELQDLEGRLEALEAHLERQGTRGWR